MDVIVEIYSTSDFILRSDFLFYNENPLVLQVRHLNKAESVYEIKLSMGSYEKWKILGRV